MYSCMETNLFSSDINMQKDAALPIYELIVNLV